MNRLQSEIGHFSKLDHIWWGARTLAGQKRYDSKFIVFTKLCRPTRKMKILEIGCGDGEFTRRLASLGASVLATDITPKVIIRAKQSFHKNKNIFFKVDNAEKMSLANEQFNIVCGVSILHHVNIMRTLKEIFRVLKRGSQLFFTEPNILNPVVLAGLNLGFLRQRMEFSDSETALSRWQVEKLLKQIGFRHYRVLNYDFLFPFTPPALIKTVQALGAIMEKTPLIKEISGSLIIWAKK